MFYSHELLCGKKGKFSAIWIAATRGDKNLTRRDIQSVNIEHSCKELLQYIHQRKQLRLSLYLMSQLTYGITLIYKKKTLLLLSDLQELQEKSFHSFQPHLLDLPTGARANTIDQPMARFPDDPLFELGNVGEIELPLLSTDQNFGDISTILFTTGDAINIRQSPDKSVRVEDITLIESNHSVTDNNQRIRLFGEELEPWNLEALPLVDQQNKEPESLIEDQRAQDPTLLHSTLQATAAPEQIQLQTEQLQTTVCFEQTADVTVCGEMTLGGPVTVSDAPPEVIKDKATPEIKVTDMTVPVLDLGDTSALIHEQSAIDQQVAEVERNIEKEQVVQEVIAENQPMQVETAPETGQAAGVAAQPQEAIPSTSRAHLDDIVQLQRDPNESVYVVQEMMGASPRKRARVAARTSKVIIDNPTFFSSQQLKKNQQTIESTLKLRHDIPPPASRGLLNQPGASVERLLSKPGRDYMMISTEQRNTWVSSYMQCDASKEQTDLLTAEDLRDVRSRMWSGSFQNERVESIVRPSTRNEETRLSLTMIQENSEHQIDAAQNRVDQAQENLPPVDATIQNNQEQPPPGPELFEVCQMPDQTIQFEIEQQQDQQIDQNLLQDQQIDQNLLQDQQIDQQQPELQQPEPIVLPDILFPNDKAIKRRLTELFEDKGSAVSFYELCPRGSARRDATLVFRTILTLAKYRKVTILQDSPYDTIYLTPSPE